MRHGYFGKKLSRNTNERRRLFLMLARELIDHGMIKTTLAKARAVQPLVEKLVTKAKKGSSADKRQLYKVLADNESVARLTNWAHTRFNNRTSGFTRIVKMGYRLGDNSEEVMFTFVDPVSKIKVSVKKEEPKTQAKTATKTAMKKSVKKKQIKKSK